MYITKTVLKKKKTEPKEIVSGNALIGKPCCGAERTESSKVWGGISKICEEKEKEGDKGEGTEGERKGKRQRRS